MFGALQQGSTLYVLDKTGEEPKLGITTITGKTEANSMTGLWAQPLQSSATVDITVSYPDGTTNTFQKLPAASCTYQYEKAIVTETGELMQQHLENALRQSQAVLDSVKYHQRAIIAYEKMMKQLSPSYAKEKATDERLDTLEKGLGDIKSILMKLASNESSSKFNQKN